MRLPSTSRRHALASTVLLIAAGALPALVWHQPSAKAQATGNIPKVPSAVTASHYDLRFGENPYLPGNASADFPGFLKPEEVPSAAYCGHCHKEVHHEWRQSAHANSFRTPWYVKNVAQLATDKGVAYTRHCESCHNPVALFTGALTPGSTVSRPHDDDGVTCMVCHSIRRVDEVRGIGSYVYGKPAVMVDEHGAPQPGLPSDAEVLAHLDRHSKAVMQPFYRSSEYCGSCHKAAIPASVNGYKWLRTFTGYDEWQQSSWSTETPLTFYQKDTASSCQTCHMPRDLAGKDGHTYASHRWLGANTAVPAQYGFDEQAKRVVDYLKANQVTIDIFAITVEHTAPKAGEARFVPSELVAPLGSRAFEVLPGDTVRVDVVVRNKGIGHTLVPELRDFYESWLDIAAISDSGQTLYRSGAVDADHHVDPAARSYTLRILGQDGSALDHHEVWKTYTKAYDATISPGRSDVVRYRFRVPPGTRGVQFTASVRYRRFRREFTDWVFGDKPSDPDRFPTVTMATGSFHFQAGQNAALPSHPVAPDTTDLLRWNNYGIGMLERQQFAEAADAFSHVIALDPAYEPGHVNLAIAEYSRGRYDAALAEIDRAERITPTDPRAEYYRGLCLRWQGHFADAVPVLEPVARRYRRFRQVHQELGYIYMVLKRFPEARNEYETVLRIDPDDPITHRWLGPVYAAMGDKARAAEEARLAAQTGNDTAAGWTAQAYWRLHPELASKSMPAHTFSEGDRMDDADLSRVLQLQNPPSYLWVEHF